MRRMKKWKVSLLLVAVCASVFSMSVLPAAARSERGTLERVKMVLRSQIVFDDFCLLAESVDANDPAKILQTVLVIYPDLVSAMKKSVDGNITAAHPNGEKYEKVVTEALNETVITDDFCKLCAAVDEGDGGKILECILEIYPDFVTTLRKELTLYPVDTEEETESGTEALLLGPGLVIASSGDLQNPSNDHRLLFYLLTGIGGLLIGSAVTYLILRKRIKAA